MTTVVVDRPADLSPALRAVRLDERITQSALAALAGVGRQWLNAFEMGDRPSAPLDMVMRVAAALGVSVRLDRPPAPRGGTARNTPIDLDALLENL
ncbi:MAG: helix-turn-helix transcriptional regulator [Gordonia sp. (in: high G+C Gram-positive bacteria)]